MNLKVGNGISFKTKSKLIAKDMTKQTTTAKTYLN